MASRRTANLFDVTDIPRRLYLAFNHLEFDGLAGLVNVLGKDRAFFDALEDLLGFLAILPSPRHGRLTPTNGHIGIATGPGESVPVPDVGP
jgi:hypothetical protein